MADTGTRAVDICAATGYSKGHISQVLSGQANVGLELAAALEKFTKRRVKAIEWVNGGAK